MLTRRDTLKAAALAGVGAAVSVVPVSAFALPVRTVAVVDPRFPGFERFSAVCRADACDVVGTTRDIDRLWREFQRRWKTDPVPLIGFTRRSDFILFSQLGATNGLRQAFHGRYRVDTGGRTVYRLTAPAPCCHAFERALNVSGDWAAALVGGATATVRQSVAGQPVTRSLASAASSPAGLVSWALVPAAAGVGSQRS